MRRAISFFVLFAFFVQGSFVIPAQDIVMGEEITFASSVFILRSSNKSQKKFAPGKTKVRKRSSSSKVREQIAYKISPKSPTKTRQTQSEKASRDIASAAMALLEKGEYETAIDYFIQAISLDPKNQDAKIGLSRAYTVKANQFLDSKRLDRAEYFYKEAIKYDANNAAAYAGLGEVYEELERRDEALKNYEKALSINPQLEDLYLTVGILYLEKGDLAKADEYISKAAVKSETAETKYLKGVVYYRLDKYQEALATLNDAVRLDPNNAEAYYYLGETYDRLNREQEALDSYRQATRLNPNFFEAWFDMGVILYNRNRYEDAIEAYKKAIQLRPDYGEAYLNLANALRKTKKYQEAVSYYEVAANFIKDDADLYSEWGFCLAVLGKWNNAIEKLTAATNVSADSVDYANLGWAYYNSAQEDLRNKRDAQAREKLLKGKEALQRAVQLNPRLAPAFLNLGITLTDLGEYEFAVQALSRAVDLRKRWIFAINELGIAYRKLGKLDLAVKHFQEALQIDQNFVPALYNLGETEARRGNKKEAQKAQERLKKLNPELAKQLDIIISAGVLKEDLKKDLKDDLKRKLPIRVP
ncbi:MAG: tetratricopeptide repeat protein [Pyrinomonadaceae bacterium]|nr:tetratricopeptide repeat protein [Pyrinomonadaceae bacterium]MCX7640038.1 tetratricopeptide repeat protein [Pyrinomonadaceae bacterium]MDW8304210.1 tetratricopeptide repeat protein [Acidobacteriota bacterium]